jgi:hypothetical protein
LTGSRPALNVGNADPVFDALLFGGVPAADMLPGVLPGAAGAGESIRLDPRSLSTGAKIPSPVGGAQRVRGRSAELSSPGRQSLANSQADDPSMAGKIKLLELNLQLEKIKLVQHAQNVDARGGYGGYAGDGNNNDSGETGGEYGYGGYPPYQMHQQYPMYQHQYPMSGHHHPGAMSTMYGQPIKHQHPSGLSQYGGPNVMVGLRGAQYGDFYNTGGNLYNPRPQQHPNAYAPRGAGGGRRGPGGGRHLDDGGYHSHHQRPQQYQGSHGGHCGNNDGGYGGGGRRRRGGGSGHRNQRRGGRSGGGGGMRNRDHNREQGEYDQSRDTSHRDRNRERMLFNAGPGPPIQMSSSDSGPDGANLFVFHIPNWCSNRQLFELFEPHGNLLSCRIFVDKISGRSRGFGFVSFAFPDDARRAISNMNGYELGHKRLKVELKRIRQGKSSRAHAARSDQDQEGGDSSRLSMPKTGHNRGGSSDGSMDGGSEGSYTSVSSSTSGSDHASDKAVPGTGGEPCDVNNTEDDTPKLHGHQQKKIGGGADLSTELWKAAGRGDLLKVRRLFDNGARLDWQHPGRCGTNAMHHACQFDQQAVTEWLVSRGVDVKSTDFEGNTPVHVAAMYGHTGILRYLHASGGRMETQNKLGESPLDVAQAYGKDRVVHLLKTLIGPPENDPF